MSDTMPARAHYALVTRMAARAFAPRLCTVSTDTQRECQRPVKGQYPRLVAVGHVDQRVDIVGIVEAVENLYALKAAARRWLLWSTDRLPWYLYGAYCLKSPLVASFPIALCFRQSGRRQDGLPARGLGMWAS
jgi:hypothetical protein